MSKFQIESTLISISESVFKSKDWKEAKKIILEYLETTRVKDKDKMIQEVTKLNNLNSIHRYFTNALLKYEGLGISQLQKNKNYE